MGVAGDTDLTHRLADSLAVGNGYLNLPELVQDLLRAMTFPRYVCLPSRAQYLIFQLDSFEGVRSLSKARFRRVRQIDRGTEGRMNPKISLS